MPQSGHKVIYMEKEAQYKLAKEKTDLKNNIKKMESD